VNGLARGFQQSLLDWTTYLQLSLSVSGATGQLEVLLKPINNDSGTSEQWAIPDPCRSSESGEDWSRLWNIVVGHADTNAIMDMSACKTSGEGSLVGHANMIVMHEARVHLTQQVSNSWNEQSEWILHVPLTNAV